MLKIVNYLGFRDVFIAHQVFKHVATNVLGIPVDVVPHI